MNRITLIFLQYCKEKKIFPESILNNPDWIKNMDYLLIKIKEHYQSGGKPDWNRFLQEETPKENIIIVEGHTPAPSIKNCPECPKEEDYIRVPGKEQPKIIQFIEEKVKNATSKRRK